MPLYSVKWKSFIKQFFILNYKKHKQKVKLYKEVDSRTLLLNILVQSFYQFIKYHSNLIFYMHTKHGFNKFHTNVM